MPAPPEAITGIVTARRHRGGQLAVEAAARAVLVDRRQQDFAGAAIGRLARPLDGIARRGLLPLRA